MISCVSQIAWTREEHLEALDLLSNHGITQIEIAPSLLFGEEDDPFFPSKNTIEARMKEFSTRGLTPISMQSLLFNLPDGQLFGTRKQRDVLNNRMKACIKIAIKMGIKNLVFGSPKQRIKPKEMSRQEALEKAYEACQTWASFARGTPVKIGLECNPSIYGGNWWTNHDDLVTFLKETPDNIGLTLDYGAILANQEDPSALIKGNQSLITHAHLSAPYLKEPNVEDYDLKALNLLKRQNTPISLEMGRLNNGLISLDAVLKVLTSK